MADTADLRKPKPDSASRGPARAGRSLRSQNRKLLRWLDTWLATPDDRGENWWSEFEADLRRNRVTFHSRQTA